MKLKNGLIANDNFISAFQKFFHYDMTAKQCLEFSASLDEVTSQYSILKRAQRVIVEKYCLKNEDGSIKYDEQENVLFPSKEEEGKCKKEINEILKDEFEIPLSSKIKVKAEDKFQPLEIRMLRDIIEIEGVDTLVKDNQEVAKN